MACQKKRVAADALPRRQTRYQMPYLQRHIPSTAISFRVLPARHAALLAVVLINVIFFFFFLPAFAGGAEALEPLSPFNDTA